MNEVPDNYGRSRSGRIRKKYGRRSGTGSAPVGEPNPEAPAAFKALLGIGCLVIAAILIALGVASGLHDAIASIAVIQGVVALAGLAVLTRKLTWGELSATTLIVIAVELLLFGLCISADSGFLKG